MDWVNSAVLGARAGHPFLAECLRLTHSLFAPTHQFPRSPMVVTRVLKEMGLRVAPTLFPMRHYLFLSVEHLLAKYTRRTYDPAELRRGWHGWRSRLKPDLVKLPSQAELRLYTSDEELDPINPRTQDFAAQWAAPDVRGWRRWFGSRSLP